MDAFIDIVRTVDWPCAAIAITWLITRRRSA